VIYLSSVFLNVNPVSFVRSYFAVTKIHNSMKTNSLEVKDMKKILHLEYEA